MKLPSKDIPQADNLDDVVHVVEAVSQGVQSYEELAQAIGKVERQGRYYRRAAEIFGFTERLEENRSSLTPIGQKLVSVDETERTAILTQALLSTRLVQRLIPFLESRGARGVSRQGLEHFLTEVADMGAPTMAHRRVSTIVGWLEQLKLVARIHDRIVLRPFPDSVPLLYFPDDEEPLFPKRYDLREYEEQARRLKDKARITTVFVDEAKKERASDSHENLIRMVAQRIRKQGGVPKTNRYIDLSAKVSNAVYLFEMKSITESNVHSQVRLGLSQLYEYRYVQDIPESKLVLVIEKPFTQKMDWLTDYLINDRRVLVAWDGDGTFGCPPKIKSEISFLFSAAP